MFLLSAWEVDFLYFGLEAFLEGFEMGAAFGVRVFEGSINLVELHIFLHQLRILIFQLRFLLLSLKQLPDLCLPRQRLLIIVLHLLLIGWFHLKHLTISSDHRPVVLDNSLFASSDRSDLILLFFVEFLEPVAVGSPGSTTHLTAHFGQLLQSFLFLMIAFDYPIIVIPSLLGKTFLQRR